jgi:glucose-6-phosphate isomerase
MSFQHGKIRDMNTSTIAESLELPAPILMDLGTGSTGEDTRIERATKTIGQMAHVFLDERARSLIGAETAVYSVEYWRPVAEGTEGGLYWGNSTIYPGVVGEEYFMTRGHFHARRNRAEYYSTILGSGLLVLMDERRHASVQEMRAGTTHYIPNGIAHRVVNTGDKPLTFLACWPSDAGHDYTTIDEQGFSVRVMRKGKYPQVVAQP